MTQYFPPEIGAAQARLDYYANFFNRLGHKVTVLTVSPNYPNGVVCEGYRNCIFQREQYHGIDIVRSWFWEDERRTGVARLKWFLSFMMSSFLTGMMLARPDVILVENPPLFSGITANLLGRLKGIPVVNHMSDMWVDAALNFGFLKEGWQLNIARSIEKFVLSKCDGIVSVTDKVHDHALKYQHASRVRLLPNGVDTELYKRKSPDESLLQHLGLQDKFVVTYAGTMGFQHGLDVIIDAAEILQNAGDEYRFLFIGEGSERERIKLLVTERHLDNVIFIVAQPQERLVDYLNLSHVGISTLKNADFTTGVRPVKMFSYMACELPVIATDIGESGALMSDAACGIAVKPEDSQAIVDALRSIKSDTMLQQEYGRKGRKFVEEHFSRSKSAANLLDFIDYIVAQRRTVS